MNDINKSLDTKETNKDTPKVADCSSELPIIINKLKALSILFCYSGFSDYEPDLKKEEISGVAALLDGVVRELEVVNEELYG